MMTINQSNYVSIPGTLVRPVMALIDLVMLDGPSIHARVKCCEASKIIRSGQ